MHRYTDCLKRKFKDLQKTTIRINVGIYEGYIQGQNIQK